MLSENLGQLADWVGGRATCAAPLSDREWAALRQSLGSCAAIARRLEAQPVPALRREHPVQQAPAAGKPAAESPAGERVVSLAMARGLKRGRG